MRTNTVAWVAGIIILLVILFLLFGQRLSGNQTNVLVSPTPTASFNSSSPQDTMTPSPTESITPSPSPTPTVTPSSSPSVSPTPSSSPSTTP